MGMRHVQNSGMFDFELLDRIETADACTPLEAIIGSETFKPVQMERLTIDSKNDTEVKKGQEDHAQRLDFEEFENMMTCGQCDQDYFHDNNFHVKLSDSDPSIHSPIQEIKEATTEGERPENSTGASVATATSAATADATADSVATADATADSDAIDCTGVRRRRQRRRQHIRSPTRGRRCHYNDDRTDFAQIR